MRIVNRLRGGLQRLGAIPRKEGADWLVLLRFDTQRYEVETWLTY